MLEFSFSKMAGSDLKVVCLGAHSDDIEIGCGGTILKLASDHPDLRVDWIVLGSNGQRKSEAVESAKTFLREVKEKKIVIKGFRDSFFPYVGAEIKEFFEQLKQDINPDVIFTPYLYDLHQDHRLVSELTWNTFRDHLILEYEIPKYDGDLGSPNLFFHLEEAFCNNKVNYILEHFKSQANRHWFTEDTFYSVMRLRGIESRSPSKYSEAFYCRKIVFSGS